MKCMLDAPTASAQCLATTAVLAEYVLGPQAPQAMLYVAPIADRALVLGQHQRRDAAVATQRASEAGVPVDRRITGGPTAFVGPGVLYASLALRHASVLMECPPEKILNRNVRGFLSGLGHAGAPAHYFGREWISVDKRPAALVGWSRSVGGGVVLECFMAHRASFTPPADFLGYGPRETPQFLGKLPVILEDVWGRSVSAEEIFGWLVTGHGQRYPNIACEVTGVPPEVGERAKLLANERASEKATAAGGLNWSLNREIPIGFLQAGLRLGSDGTVEDAQLTGDFFQDDGARQALRERLAGHAPDAARFANAINQTYDGKNHVIEGVRDLNPALEAFLDVAAVSLRMNRPFEP
jgi:hypothetical protein